MALQVSSYLISIDTPWNAKVGERVYVRVDFTATVFNDEHEQPIDLRLTGLVSDSQGVASGSNYDDKTAHYGSTTLYTNMQVPAIYTSAGWITIYGRIQVYDRSRWINILDTTDSRWFNVVE